MGATELWDRKRYRVGGGITTVTVDLSQPAGLWCSPVMGSRVGSRGPHNQEGSVSEQDACITAQTLPGSFLFPRPLPLCPVKWASWGR